MDKIKSLLYSQTSKDTFISLVGSGVVAVAGLIFTFLLARSLEPENFGIYSSITALVGIVSVLGDLGIGAALINFLPKMPNKRQVLIATSFWFQVIIAFVFALLVSFSSLINDLFIPGSVAVHLVVAGLLTGVYILNQYAVFLLKAEKKFLTATIVQSIDSVGKLALASLLFFNSQLTIGLALSANVLSVAISTIYAMRREFKSIPFILPKFYLKKIFSFAKWIGISRVFGVAISRIDIILLNIMHSSFAAGIFAAASRVILVFALIVSSLGAVVAPRFAGFTKRAQTISYLKKLLTMITLISLSMIFVVILAEPIILLVFGPKYLEAVPVFKALTIALIPFLFSLVTSNPIIYTYNQPDYFAKVMIVQVVILITLDVILIPTMGAMAPAIALGVSNTVMLIMGGVRLKKLLA